MFSHSETLALFSLAILQGVLISELLQKASGLSLVLTLAGGCFLGFILASLELTVFRRMFGSSK